MSKYTAMIALFIVSLGIMIAASGCGNSKSSNSGLLEQNGITNAGDLDFVVIQVTEANNICLITDETTVSRVYQLLNDAKHVSGISKYYRPNRVTLVRKTGGTLSFGFGLYNPALTWKYESQDFVEFVKTEVIANSKYINKERLPAFSIGQVARIVGSAKRVSLPPAKAQKAEQAVQLLASAYIPLSWVTKTSDWSNVAQFCTNSNPGFEVALSKPIRFQTLVGWTGPEPNGSDALKLLSLTVDKMLVYRDGQELSLAFHSGNTWYVTRGFISKDLQGKTPESVYRGL